MLIKHRQLCSKNVQSKVSFARAIYHTSKHFCACVGKSTCDPTPLLKGPVTSTMLLFHTLGHVKSILYVCSFKIYTLAGPVRRFSTHMWQNVYINIIRCGMKCDVYFPFLKVLFKKPKMNVFIFHLLAFSNICNLQQN